MSFRMKICLGIAGGLLGLVGFASVFHTVMNPVPEVGPERLTRWSLHGMALALMDYYATADEQERQRIREWRTLDDLWLALSAKRHSNGHALVRADEKQLFQVDARQRPFVLQVKVRGHDTCLQIFSAGADGFHEAGQGDDQYLEIVFDGKRVIRVIIGNPVGDLLKW